MLYRIKIDLAFKDIEDADELLDKTQDLIDKAQTIKPNTFEEEIGYIRLERCFHDEYPPQTCLVLQEHFTQ